MSDIHDRFLGKKYGKYRGIVTNVKDKKKMGRIMAHVYNIHFEDPDTGEKPSTPWAYPCSGGNFNSGQVSLPKVGSTVWIEFEEGDTDKPLWSPGPWTLWTGKSDIPRHTRGVYDHTDSHMRGTAEIPPPQINASYGESGGTFTAGGCKIEVDDTPNNKRVVIEHPSGSRYEILDDGSCQDISSNRREVYNGRHYTKVTGARDLAVDGKTTQIYSGRDVVQNGVYTQIHLKNAIYTFKNRDTTVNGETKLVRGSDSVEVFGNKTTTVGGNSNVMTLGEYNLAFAGYSTWLGGQGLQINPGLGFVTIARTPQLQVPIDPTVDFMAKATELLLWLSTHVHPTPSGPSSIPLVPPSPTIFSTSLKAQ